MQTGPGLLQDKNELLGHEAVVTIGPDQTCDCSQRICQRCVLEQEIPMSHICQRDIHCEQ